MGRIQKVKVAVVAAGAIALSGCGSITLPNLGFGSSAQPHFVYQGIDFGPGRNESFKQGVVAGCATAAGNYTKDHTLYQNDISYRTGWKSGRMQCGKSTVAKR